MLDFAKLGADWLTNEVKDLTDEIDDVSPPWNLTKKSVTYQIA